MNKEVIGFGIIGCGMVSEWHAKAILEISGAKLVGVTDTLEKSRLEFAKRFNTLAFGSVDELLENPEIGVVCMHPQRAACTICHKGCKRRQAHCC